MWYDDTSVKSVTREYKSQDALNKDAAAAAAHGWVLASVSQVDQRSGCVRIVLLAFLALLWKPKPRYLAVFTHP
jgi:hypothetical protein